MTSVGSRRMIECAGLVLASLGFVAAYAAMQHSFIDAASWSGILLFALLIFLMLFSVRKRLPFLPLIRASIWLRVHLYVGLFSIVVFLAHNGISVPQGNLERLLAAFFVVTAASGMIGFILAQVLPSRLTAHGENLTYEQIPALCQSLRKEVEQLVITSAESTDSSTIADFYQANLARYFSKPSLLFGAMLIETRAPVKLLERLEGLRRYLNPEEEKIAEKLKDFVLAKENLDVQWNLQGILKLWLFVHIPFSVGLLAIALTHIALVWKF